MNHLLQGKNDYEPRLRKTSLNDAFFLADEFINRNYLTHISKNEVIPLEDNFKNISDIRLFKISKIIYDSSQNILDKLTSIYNSVLNINSSCIMLINSTYDGIEFYFGVRTLIGVSTAGKILEKSFKGNFPGSDVINLKNKDIEELMNNIIKPNVFNQEKSITSVSMVPSKRKEDELDFVQGLEKFINAMQGEEYTAVFIAEPIDASSLEQRKKGYEELHTLLTPFQSTSFNYGENYSEAISDGITKNLTDSINESITNTQGGFRSYSVGYGRNDSFSFGGISTGHSRNETFSNGVNWSKAATKGSSKSTSEGTTYTDTKTSGNNKSYTINFENKSVSTLLEKVNTQLDRIKACESFGLWECSGYFIANDVQTSVLAANTYKSLVTGHDSGVENSFVNIWDNDNTINTKHVLEYIKYLLHPEIKLDVANLYNTKIVRPTSLVSGVELPILLGLPRKSVNGVTVIEMSEFGRNIFTYNQSELRPKVDMGKIFHMGETETTSVKLDVESLSMHCFITGSTGSGKSNTSYQLLSELIKNDVKFLVIEPAKGEYKTAFGGLENVNVFGTNINHSKLLRINPFIFPKQVHILEHLDRLIEIFNACWPMFGAMPAILKEGIERIYREKGWDLNKSINIYGVEDYPNFSDLLVVLPEIINETKYSGEAKGNYIGGLVTRVKSLTNGILGQILNGKGLDDQILFDENCIVDISRIGSTETKSLIMGLLFLKLQQYRLATAQGTDVPLKHVTVLEEAHNLLRRTSFSQSQEGANLQGKSVEMISNGIAEMRTYGEGFIIVDQSPSVLDESVIRNTNTKIIMRLPDEADRQAVGKACCLNEGQIKELSRLNTGVACIYQNDWVESVLCKVHRFINKKPLIYQSLSPVDEKALKGQFIKQFFSQFSQPTVDVDINNVLYYLTHHVDCSHEMKKELIAIINNPRLIKKITPKKISELLSLVLNCEEILNIIVLDFRLYENSDEKNKKAMTKAWRKNMLEAIDQYVTLTGEKHERWYKDLIIKNLLEYRMQIDKSNTHYCEKLLQLIYKK